VRRRWMIALCDLITKLIQPRVLCSFDEFNLKRRVDKGPRRLQVGLDPPPRELKIQFPNWKRQNLPLARTLVLPSLAPVGERTAVRCSEVIGCLNELVRLQSCSRDCSRY
jgi:hypothetical protein